MSVTSIVTMLLIFSSLNPISSTDFNQITAMFEEHMGYGNFKEYMNKVQVCPKSISGSDVINKIADAIGELFKNNYDVLESLKQTIEANANATDYKPPNCCDERNDDEQSDVFNTRINSGDYCYRSFNGKVNLTSGPTRSKTLLDQMKENDEKFPNDDFPLKWQYYGAENGGFVIYPSVQTEICNFESRTRPWYKETATTGKFAVIIVIDHSTSACKNILDQEKLAVETVLHTLNPADWVNVIEFGSEAFTPDVTCFANKLVKALPNNIITLNETVYKIDSTNCEQSNYKNAFNRAFTLFEEHLSQHSDDIQENLVLFMTDGDKVPETTLSEYITQRNTALGDSVRIIPYIFSDAIDYNNTLCKISRNQKKTGDCTFIGLNSSNEDVRYKIGAYYKFSGTFNDEPYPVVTIPFVEADTYATTTAVCLPAIYPNSHGETSLQGVTCVEIPIRDIIGTISFEEKGRDSYVFVIHESGRVLLHPRLPKLGTYYLTPPTFIDIGLLESDPIVIENVIEKIKQGQTGSENVFVDFVKSGGNDWMDGNYQTKKEMTYHFRPIPLLKGYSVCYVQINEEMTYSYRSTIPSGHVLISNVMQTQTMCAHNEEPAYNGSSAVFLTKKLFMHPRTADLNDERYLDRLKSYFEGQDVDDVVSGNVKPGVKHWISVSGLMDSYWTLNDSIVTASTTFFASSMGFLRLYPGISLSSEYDFTLERWYKKAMLRGNTMVLTRNDKSSFNGKPSITIGRTVRLDSRDSYCGDGSSIVGVLGVDMKEEYVGALVKNIVDICKDSSWFLMDDSGYIIYHNELDMTGIILTDTHIGALEPKLTNELIRNSKLTRNRCASATNPKQEHISYKVNINKKIEIDNYSIEQISGTNVYIVLAKNTLRNDKGICSKENVLCPNDKFDETKCMVELSAGVSTCPSSNQPQKTTFHTKANPKMPKCFAVDCTIFSNECSCETLSDCHWCSGTCQPANAKCSRNVTGIAVGITIAIIVIIAAIIIIVYCHKKKKNSNKNVRHISDTIGSDPGFDNTTLGMDTEAFEYTNRESHLTYESMYEKVNSRSPSPAVTESVQISETSSAITVGSSKNETKTTSSELPANTRSDPQTTRQGQPSLKEIHNENEEKLRNIQGNSNTAQSVGMPSNPMLGAGYVYPDRVSMVTYPESDMQPLQTECYPYYNLPSGTHGSKPMHQGYIYVPPYGHPPNCTCGFHHIQSATLAQHDNTPPTPDANPVLMPAIAYPNVQPFLGRLMPSPGQIHVGNTLSTADRALSTIEENSRSESIGDNSFEKGDIKRDTNVKGVNNLGFVSEDSNVTSF